MQSITTRGILRIPRGDELIKAAHLAQDRPITTSACRKYRARPLYSNSSDMSGEALDKALEFQRKQSKQKTVYRPSVKGNKFARRPEKTGDPESRKVQENLAGRLGRLGGDQIKEGIQRQVGATRADWTDAEDPDGTVIPPYASETSEETVSSEGEAPLKTKEAPPEQAEPAPVESPPDTPPPPEESAQVKENVPEESSPPKKNKYAPIKRFSDGSVLYNADQFKDDN